jgi:hypothetical protein
VHGDSLLVLLLLTIWVEALMNLGKKARPEGCQTAANKNTNVLIGKKPSNRQNMWLQVADQDCNAAEARCCCKAFRALDHHAQLTSPRPRYHTSLERRLGYCTRAMMLLSRQAPASAAEAL